MNIATWAIVVATIIAGTIQGAMALLAARLIIAAQQSKPDQKRPNLIITFGRRWLLGLARPSALCVILIAVLIWMLVGQVNDPAPLTRRAAFSIAFTMAAILVQLGTLMNLWFTRQILALYATLGTMSEVDRLTLEVIGIKVKKAPDPTPPA